MVRHAFKISLLVFQCVWMLFVLPGHTRGLITLTKATPASAAGDKASHSCCSIDDAPVDDASGKAGTQKPHEPTQQQKQDCAVCYHARGLSPTPVFDFDPQPTDVTVLARLFEPTKIHRTILEPPYDALAPPAATL
jgi:hypothetical protein